MNVDTHPSYQRWLPIWEKMSDIFEGQDRIKMMRTTYLPATTSQQLDGMQPGQPGRLEYDAYLRRARFPEFVSESVKGLLGLMHKKPPEIELPSKLEPLRDRASVHGESLRTLLRKINQAQLTYGRIGLFADVRDGAPVGELPYISTYDARTLINWYDGDIGTPVYQRLRFVVLDETEQVLANDLSWQEKQKYRLLYLDENNNYHFSVQEDVPKLKGANGTRPSIAGRSPEEIPFVFVNAADNVPEPGEIPLLPLANLCLSMYMSEADYRQSLFMQGQDTLVIKGLVSSGPDGTDETTVRAGAGARIEVSSDGDAKYVGVQSEGLSEQRTALENDSQRASEMGGKMLDTRGRESESGEALSVRVGARTTTLPNIAETGAVGLQSILRHIARWVGADEEKVIVSPNTDYADQSLEGSELKAIMEAKILGAPWSMEEIHNYMRERKLTRLSYEAEMGKLEEESPPTNDDE